MLLEKNIIRNLLHFSTCIFPISLYHFGQEICLPYFITIGLLFLICDISRIKIKKISDLYDYFFNTMTKNHERISLTGASYVFISLIIVNLFFSEKIVIVSLLIMSISDPIAAIVGRWVGQLKIYNKTLEGAIAFFIATSIILINFDFSSIQIVVVALVCCIVELFSTKLTRFDDNFLIPIVASLTLRVL